MQFISIQSSELVATIRTSECTLERIKFENGVLNVEDPLLIAGIKAHPLFGRMILEAGEPQPEQPLEVVDKLPEIPKKKPVSAAHKAGALKRKGKKQILTDLTALAEAAAISEFMEKKHDKAE